MNLNDYAKLSEQIMRMYNSGYFVILKVGNAVVPERLYEIKEVVVIFTIAEGKLRYLSADAKNVSRIIKELDNE